MTEPRDPKRIVDTLRQLIAEESPESVTMKFQLKKNGGKKPKRQEEPNDPDPTPPAKAHAAAGKISHAPDFSSVQWTDGKSYSFTRHQRPIVAMLWYAMAEGYHFVSGAALLDAAEVNSSRVSDLFKGSPSWNKIIVKGMMHGGPVDTFRLAPIGDEAERGAT